MKHMIPLKRLKISLIKEPLLQCYLFFKFVNWLFESLKKLNIGELEIFHNDIKPDNIVFFIEEG
jgi:thiamine kinase-like enzyme